MNFVKNYLRRIFVFNCIFNEYRSTSLEVHVGGLLFSPRRLILV
ncbi:hypothetical protein SAMN06269250_5615 [Spirosoma fluviale]|uniref:Uncharacterized protein n=1 Tax=Spirosoma fluviale TaxID=1597977 RepID=A0A286GN83_9BACT|nr:hypothetical protein SAMN06269250_5615 [Spirosoma fluviale]